ncbi:MAG: Maf family nucleotide pyrophosphatase [Muribaculaceae bacterium]|nr:Maf family nucleotide pyrophosphatase [Muribaculaceae bacterium]
MIPAILPPRLHDVRLVLASASPRRRELLQMLVPDVTIAPVRDVDETYPPGLDAMTVPEYLSRLKASAYAGDIPAGSVLVTADTVVVLDGRILGKPATAAAACDMLRALSGRTHTVVTGVTLTGADGRCESFSERTEVEFAALTDAEIEAYVDTYRPLDKAGAYGIQEWIGGMGICGIRGCFYNVMGLPLHALYARLKKI